MSSRRGSMDVSRASIVQDTSNRVLQNVANLDQSAGETRDPEQCENKPSLFAAEQTWPTEEEIKNAQKQRRVSADGEMEMEINTNANN